MRCQYLVRPVSLGNRLVGRTEVKNEKVEDGAAPSLVEGRLREWNTVRDGDMIIYTRGYV